jgi:hypothetical protein
VGMRTGVADDRARKPAPSGYMSDPFELLAKGAMMRFVSVMTIVVGVCLSTAALAMAAPVYSVGGRFGAFNGSGAEGTFFSFGPDGVALDPATGDGYAVDGGNARVQKFSAALSPTFLLTYGWRVQAGGGNEFGICTSGCTFGTEGSGAGQFGGQFKVDNTQPVGVAVSPISKDAYVADTLNNRVEYFSEGGTFVGQFNGAGTPSGSFARPRGMAVNSAGDVFVEDTGHGVIDKFSSTGTFLCRITGLATPASEECSGTGSATPDGGLSLSEAFGAGLAADAGGNLYVADTGHNVVDEFSAGGAFMRQFGAGKLSGPQAVGVESSGNLFVVSGGSTVDEFDASGALINEIGDGTIGQSYGVTATAEGERVYVSDRAKNEVLIFGVFVGVSTEPASNITLTSAALNGMVNPNGEELTLCQFEYGEGETGAFEHTVVCEQEPAAIGKGTTAVPVTAKLTGLSADSPYHFRLVARNAHNTSEGAPQSFTTIEPVFGFQLGGPNAVEMLVSSEADQREPAAGSATALDSQAGSHPFDVTTRFLVNTEPNGDLPLNLQPKDYYVNIPAGFAGNVAKVPRCKMSELSSLTNRQRPAGCPTASQIGVIRLFRGKNASVVSETEVLPVYNMVSPSGVPAEFAFPYILIGEPVVFQVRSDGDFGVTAEVRNISEVLPIVGSQLTLWGVPADSRHDAERFLPERGASSNSGFRPGDKEGKPLPAGTAEVPFLTNPTACGTQKEASIAADSWLHPGRLAEDGRPIPGGEGWVTVDTQMFTRGITGCDRLTFNPELKVTPTTTVADSPTGLTVELSVPQSEGPNNLATPALKDARVTLPSGLAISPSQGNGLEGCTPDQIKLDSTAQPECPNASQVGKLELTTPLLPEVLTGQIYLSSERSGSTYHIYLVIRGNGILIKLEGAVTADEQTGQLAATFDENPQLQFSKLTLIFYGGPNASLATPNACGSYQTTSLLEPWSHNPAEGEAHGTPDATPFAEPFTINTGCVTGFAPSFHAGSANPVAGAFSPFSLTVSRNDGEQELSRLQVKLPKGLVGDLAGVAKCSGTQIAAAERNTGAAEKANPSCPAASQIGTVQAGAGPGEAPFFLPGRAYLTGPYRGAPYGIVAIVPVLAGPFDLGTVVVRAAISIDPHTAQVTVTSDPLPRMLDGIPLRVRRIHVSINTPKFTVNPTNCEPTKVVGLLSSFTGAQHSASARFQVMDCASLAFKPGFRVFTKARHTKRFGAFLRVKVTSGSGQANIRSVLVRLPRALPSRVATLKGACGERQFEANPAGCPAASRVGTAIARTPILSTPLTGPAIFVSHGGAAFPDLDIVLQGSGITVILEGNTNIHHNITTSNFKSAPDVPVSSFELTLPTGPHSALSANGNLCFKTVKRGRHRVRRRVKLVMPTTITGQNGAVMHRNTRIAVQGCAGGARGRRG